MVLIVDDSPMNRDILSEILCDDFEILEAPNGPKCLELLNAWGSDISIVLLDIVMPDMDGFDVLSRMSAQGWLEDIPVVMISSEDSSQTVRRAYELGASDYISRPFDARIVHRRVSNVTRLYARQRRLSALVSQQFYDREKNDQMMIGILGQVMEIHNSESIHHISRVQRITSILLERLCQKTDIYGLSGMDRYLITTASSLHDIGKVAIDDRILNAHDLTPEQTAILHTHPILGAQMLENLSQYQDEPLVKFAIQICRWHHERWDGSGYPDGRKGDDIPIAAQVVALADAYDGLVGKRDKHEALSQEEAVAELTAGKRGAFNPLLLECLRDIQNRLAEETEGDTPAPRKKGFSLTKLFLDEV
jgi:diguanylate cyclase (GGDEF) domain